MKTIIFLILFVAVIIGCFYGGICLYQNVMEQPPAEQPPAEDAQLIRDSNLKNKDVFVRTFDTTIYDWCYRQVVNGYWDCPEGYEVQGDKIINLNTEQPVSSAWLANNVSGIFTKVSAEGAFPIFVPVDVYNEWTFYKEVGDGL